MMGKGGEEEGASDGGAPKAKAMVRKRVDHEVSDKGKRKAETQRGEGEGRSSGNQEQYSCCRSSRSQGRG